MSRKRVSSIFHCVFLGFALAGVITGIGTRNWTACAWAALAGFWCFIEWRSDEAFWTLSDLVEARLARIRGVVRTSPPDNAEAK